ncbi:hypothetical protein LTR99_009553 [Exophiala xenobiotica]|uniref:Uncharacterized protein n=1 Tax=Vermiconidia calcicola TaxID=1690605 RepID=A0AAV9Q4Q7_9PEZI|nr:hypothetical protein LTR96_001653 [Exophiala xenobiotica]KAK5530742.1 hypothetical protein LTR23_010202 [Chaetothyriales sp. CCFEE 6169]KAK5533286.1 hypothetical protein LTR25_007151 [Vermiconidia calcicola]KAK5294155.1 hypothetical protein LTR99_009553 [Exophiala xenobiotica]KAK5333078.1 hypothetical protein LTR98_010820 [Exophiala xenobiotica]
MEQSRSLYRILLEDQAPAAAAYTESRADSCFSPDSGQVQLRVFVRQHHNGTKPLEKPVLGSQGPPLPEALPDGPEWDKTVSLNLLDIRSPANLVEFYNVSSKPNPEKPCAECLEEGKAWHYHLVGHYPESPCTSTDSLLSFIDQKTSRSRVNISLACFTTLLQTYQISDHLSDFMCCFGRPSGEIQLAPPPIQFRWHSDEGRDSVKSFASWDDTFPENQFSLHLILINSAAATWRSYLSYIAEEVRNVAEQAILADFDNDGIHLGELEERQYLKQLEDMITDLMTAVDSSLDICSVLQAKHAQYAEEPAQRRAQPSQQHHALFNQVIAEKEREFRHYRAQVDVLRMRIRSAEALVTNILDLGNGNTLKMLALEAQRENQAMQSLTMKGTRDAAAVKVLTVVTLVYLPTTAVLLENFFSTSFVDFGKNGNGSPMLTVAGNWWIALAVAAPLTVITIYIWWFYVESVVYQNPPTWWRLLSRGLNRIPATQKWKRRRSEAIDREMNNL